MEILAEFDEIPDDLKKYFEPDDRIKDVWNIATAPFPGAHFATFSPKLVEPCLKAGTSERGCCWKCGAPWVRVIKKTRTPTRPGTNRDHFDDSRRDGGIPLRPETETKTIGWKPSCECGEKPIPCVVLDPFAGASTVGVVAQKFNRRFVGLELKMDYCRMGKKRIYSQDVAML